MRRIAGTLMFALLLGGVINLRASSITAASCGASDVQAAMNRASAGDTVFIPAGTCHWTRSVTWTAPANVFLKGAGSLSTLGGGDATIIIDDYNSTGVMLSITAHSSGFRMAGITMQGGSGLLKQGGIFVLSGPSQNTRIDHMHFNTQTYSPAISGAKPLWVSDGVDGVLDHSIIDLNGVDALYFFNHSGSNGQGNESWATATNFGSSGYYYLEDNLFRSSTSGPIRLGDSYNGSRVVWRFNTIQGGSGLEEHAVGHAGDGRGHRSQEGYGNHFTQTSGVRAFNMVDLGSGTALIWGNVADTETLTHMMYFNVTRKNNDTYAQPGTPTSWGYCGTQFNGTGSKWDGNADASTGYPCVDQPGRGVGDMVSGSFPSKINSRTGTIASLNQALEPIYMWANEGTPHPAYGGSFYANNTRGRVVADRDYYPQASGIQTTSSSPFDGTSGTGWGIASRRPSTCTTGVGYWATDEGSWNTSTSNPEGVQQNGADGLLYLCSATNTWTLYYRPYTYPHPLQSGVMSSPTNLRIIR